MKENRRKRELSEETLATDLLIVESTRRQLHRAFKTGRFDRKSWRVLGGLTPEARQLWLEVQEAVGMAVRERCLYLGLTTQPAENPKLMDIALKAAESSQDRVRGKPTEHQQHSGRLTIVWPGIDPAKLPDKDGDRHGAPRLPAPATGRTWRQANQVANGDVTEGSANTTMPTTATEWPLGRENGDRDEGTDT